MAKHKTLLFFSMFLMIVIIGRHLIMAESSRKRSNNNESMINPTTNFFTQMENQTKVFVFEGDDPLTKGYQKIKENEFLILYLHPDTLGMAIYDKRAMYLWYSCYPSYEKLNYSSEIKDQIASGIQIECFETTSSQLVTTTKYSANRKEAISSIELISNGCLINLNFEKVGISFQVKLQLEETSLKATFLEKSLVEIPIKIANYEKKYKLKAITLFPYLGANNYEINAYSLIPDGSGALMRYTNEEYNTAFIKRIYGNDYGIQEKSILNTHLTNQQTITLPLYGINHGYQQAAFLAEITSGAGSAELHAYPFMYENVNLNRTFFKYLTRDRLLVFLSSDSSNAISVINEQIYPSDFEIKYTFLDGLNASYVGMANAYQQNLNLKPLEKSPNIPLKIDVIGQDYKPGLFGKKYFVMTSYLDLKNIVNDLMINHVDNLQITYLGWNKNGYFGNTPIFPQPSRLLGGEKDFFTLTNYLKENNIAIFYYNNPLVTSGNPLINQVIKRTNLHLFKYDFASSLDLNAYHLSPLVMASNILKDKTRYEKLGITNFNLDYVGSASFSYIENGKEVYRSEMIKIIKDQINQLRDYKIGLTTPNDYLYNNLNSYYNAPYESSRYTFFTDSIPFISLILSGMVEQYAPFTNFISDYHLYALRLIEYNLYPSYLLTKKPSYHLRYTNFEYVYTSEYEVWKDEIFNRYQQINEALRYVAGEKIINHYYLSEGVACIEYSNHIKILINYTLNDYVYNGDIIPALNYYVKEDS